MRAKSRSTLTYGSDSVPNWRTKKKCWGESIDPETEVEYNDSHFKTLIYTINQNPKKLFSKYTGNIFIKIHKKQKLKIIVKIKKNEIS